jgi:hypothetical protein
VGKILLDAINGKSGVRVEATDVIVVRPAKQDDISSLPIANGENNVFVLNFSQRAILTQPVNFLAFGHRIITKPDTMPPERVAKKCTITQGD